MLDRMTVGQVPPKHHIRSVDSAGALLFEHCFTRQGFDGPYTISYHRQRPHEQRPCETKHGWKVPPTMTPGGRRLAKRHFRGFALGETGGPPVDARVPVLFNEDLEVSVVRPNDSDPVYFSNGDADDLFFIESGGGVLRSPLGDVVFERHDYLMVPRGLPHRFVLSETAGAQRWLVVSCAGGLGLPKQWRNEVGQLRMDAPYCHRDFRRPTFTGPLDEGIVKQVVKRDGRFWGFDLRQSPLDVVGWDGSVYPWAFPIRSFQPRVGMVHLPPSWHGTFAARGALICSFVPRPTDFHPDAVPCPYPHSSVDVDEVLFYAQGDFTSRKGVDAGSLSLHPAGLPHGPHPGAYEASLGTDAADELAVMIDSFKPLYATCQAESVEDDAYMESFLT